MRRVIGTIAAVAIAGLLGSCTSDPAAAPTTEVPTSTSTTPSTSAAPSITEAPPTSERPTTAAPRTSSAPSTPTPPAPKPGVAHLPLGYATDGAGQVITVVAASHASTTAELQAWRRSQGRWLRVGPAAPAWLGSDGIGGASEQVSATPQGSFGLTEAFGREADPGTALPYRRTTPADWWISQEGPLYNTEQHCSGSCPFTQGSPNEHLYYTTPYYEYAVVIDYNRDPVRAGAGSAFFLHVTVGEPTQGCVSIARDQLVRILRWLQPGAHPRILMGVG